MEKARKRREKLEATIEQLRLAEEEAKKVYETASPQVLGMPVITQEAKEELWRLGKIYTVASQKYREEKALLPAAIAAEEEAKKAAAQP